MRTTVVLISLLLMVPAWAWSEVILWSRSVDVGRVIRGEPLRARPWYQLSVHPDMTTCRESYPHTIIQKQEGEVIVEVDDPRLIERVKALTLRCLPEGVSPNDAEEK